MAPTPGERPGNPVAPSGAQVAIPVALSSVLEALRLKLVQATVHPVNVGVPDGPQPAIYLWPWRLSVDPGARSPLPRPAVPDAPVRPDFTKVVDCLVLVEPATDPGWLQLLDTALSALLDSPVLEVAGGTALVAVNGLSAADLAAIFQASQVRMLPVVSASVRFLSN